MGWAPDWKNYLDLQEWQVAAIKDGIKDLEEGRTVPHDPVKKWRMTWGTNDET